MPVPASLDDISTTPAENSPAGTESVFPALDDYLRTIFAFVAQVREGPVLLTSFPDDFLTLAKLAQAVQHGVAQPGDFKWRFTATPGDGWLVCNGSAVSRTEYALLFDAIGTTYGAGNGTTTFNLPDMRGEFARGLDLGRGIDAGRVLGSAQADSFRSHAHPATASAAGQHRHDNGSGNQADGRPGGAVRGVGAGSQSVTGYDGDHTHTITVASAGGSETRGRNVALLPCIFTGL